MAESKRELQVVEDRAGEHEGFLRHQADATAQFQNGEGAQFLPAKADRPAARFFQSVEESHQGTFAAPRGPDDGGQDPFDHLQVEPLEDLHPLPLSIEALLADLVQLQQGSARHRQSVSRSRRSTCFISSQTSRLPAGLRSR